MSVFCKALGHKIPKHGIAANSLGGIMPGRRNLPLPAYILTRGPLEEDGEGWDSTTGTTTAAFILQCDRCRAPLARIGVTVEPVAPVGVVA